MISRRQGQGLVKFITAVVIAVSALFLTRGPADLAAQSQSPLPTPAPAARVAGQLNVFAAASLKDAFTAIGKDFEKANPGTKVVFNFAGSQQLAVQIGYGAPADVFASANTKLMDAVVKTGRVGASDPRAFVRNRLVVIYPKSNPAKITKLQDLGKSGLKLVLAAKAVPVGSYALDFLNKANAKAEFGAGFSKAVLANVVSYEEDVRAVFSKVSLGEADAGIVYSSDVIADKAATVTRLDIPSDLNTIAIYPIAPLKDSPALTLAKAFFSYTLSPAAQTVLVKYGFIATTGDATGAAPKAGTLIISGLVNKSLTVQSSALKRLKTISVKATDKGTPQQTYTGPSIADVLKLAGVKAGAKTVTFTGSDGYSQDVPLSDLGGDAGVIVIDANGTLRNIIPAKAPKFWVRGLFKIDVS